jgi:hypothetical protein
MEMMQRFPVLLALGLLGCGGGSQSGSTPPAPQSTQTTLTEFLGAVRTNDLRRMGQLWGTDRGPAAAWMDPTTLSQRLQVMQRYLVHTGFRIVDGPSAAPGKSRVQSFRVELHRSNCMRVVPFDLIQTSTGGWVVQDVHLEAAGNPMLACPPPPGTRP